jgi:hypothetical protein
LSFASLVATVCCDNQNIAVSRRDVAVSPLPLLPCQRGFLGVHRATKFVVVFVRHREDCCVIASACCLNKARSIGSESSRQKCLFARLWQLRGSLTSADVPVSHGFCFGLGQRPSSPPRAEHGRGAGPSGELEPVPCTQQEGGTSPGLLLFIVGWPTPPARSACPTQCGCLAVRALATPQSSHVSTCPFDRAIANSLPAVARTVA